MAEPHGLAERKLEFRTMLKHVADQFRPDDVESVAFIHNLPATEPRTTLGALSCLERKGMFSHDNVEPLLQLLDRICRCDIIHNCGVREYQEQYCSNREPERQESAVAGGSQPEPEITAAIISPSTDQPRSEVAVGNAQPLTDKQASTDLIPLPRDETDTHGSSLPHSTDSTPEIPPSVISTDQNPPEDAPFFKSECSGSEPSPTSPPDNLDPLLSLTQQQKKHLLERIASDEDMRTELLSMVGQQYPMLVPVSQERATVPTSDLPHPLHNGVDATSSSQLPSMEPRRGTTTLPVERLNTPASPPVIDRPLLVVGPLAGGRLPEPGDPPAGGRLSVTSPASESPNQHDPPASTGKDRTQKDCFVWKFKRTNLAKSISSHKEKPFSKELKVRADGYTRCKPVTLKFELHSCGIGHDRNNSASLQVSVAVNSCNKCQSLKQMAQLSLDVTVQIAEGNEFLATRTMLKDLSDFCIHDFLPHEVICNSELKAQTVEIKAEAYLRFDSIVPPIATTSVDTKDDWVDLEVAPRSQPSSGPYPK